MQAYDADRVRGMLAGGALGDALGAPHEFRCNRGTPYTGRLEHPPFQTTRWQGRREAPVASVTDDTEMTIALLQSLLDEGGYRPDRVLPSYLQWANSGGWMMGRNIRSLMRGVRTVRGYQGRAAQVTDGDARQSNGCLMRAAPLALLEDDWSTTDVNWTNPNPVCREAVRVYVGSLRRALQGHSARHIYRRALREEVQPQVREALLQAAEETPRDVTVDKGWVLHGLYAAYWCLLHYRHLHRALDAVVQWGGDTDTNAAIAGSLLGAVVGYERLSAHPRTADNLRRMAEAPSDREVYSYRQLLRLADRYQTQVSLEA